jgi:hypothetical protein
MTAFVRALGTSVAAKTAGLSALAFGLFLGTIGWNTFFAVVPAATKLSWSASWIRYPLPSHDDVISQSYFRKKIHLSDGPRHAWIRVMAPDAFEIYVNGKLLGQVGMLATNVTKYFDLTSELRAGTNLIALSVHRDTFPGTAEIVAEGEIEDIHGHRQVLATDGTWKAHPYEDWLLGSESEWFDARFDDARWKSAIVARGVAAEDRSRVGTTPTTITEPARGRWIWSEDAAAPRVQLRRRFEVRGPLDHAWVRVSSQAYELLVNGVPLGGSENLMGTYGDADRPVGSLDVYDIAPFLKRGPNVVAIKGTADRLNGGVYVDGRIASRDGTVERLASPDGWEASTVAPRGWASRRAGPEGFRPAVVVRELRSDEPFQLSTKTVIPPSTWSIGISLRFWGLVVLAGIASVAAWALLAWAVSRGKRVELGTAQALAGIAFAAPIAFLLWVWGLGTDIRFDQALAYRPWVVWTALAAFLPGILALAVSRVPGAPWRSWSPKVGTVATAVVLVALTAVCYALRVENLDRSPLGGDEVTMSLASRHVLTEGYPAAEVSPHLTARPATTSEIVPFFFAAVILALPNATPEFSLRFALVIFGTATLLIIYLFAKEMFGRSVGLLAAAMYAGMPIAINMAQFARYPQIVQFFAVVSAYFWYKAFVHEKIDHRALFWGTISVILTYLSWEGVAFFFVAIGLGCLCLRGTNFRWLLDKWLYVAVAALVLVAFVQLANRFIVTRPIPLIGTGIANLTPTDRWNQPLYDPFVFLRNYLAMLGLATPALFAIVGLPFVFRSRALAFTNCLLFVPLFLTTNLIEVQDFRHVYYTLPFILISGAAVLMGGLAHLRPAAGRAPRFSPISVVGMLAGAAILAFFVSSTTTRLLKPYRLKGISVTPSTMLECGDDGGIRDVVRILRNEASLGDKIVAFLPHMVYFYYGRVDFYFQNPLQIPVTVAKDGAYPVHRATGSPVITSVPEWKDVLSKNHRIWFVLPSKFSLSTFGLEDQPEVYADLSGHLRLVFEDQNAWLYLWEK